MFEILIVLSQPYCIPRIPDDRLTAEIYINIYKIIYIKYMYINKNNSSIHKNMAFTSDMVLSQIEFQENPSLYQNESMDLMQDIPMCF
jgi:hypothetical protein